MDILYLLIPGSALLVLAILGVFAWALKTEQFDDLDREGERILETIDATSVDFDQSPQTAALTNSPTASPVPPRDPRS